MDDSIELPSQGDNIIRTYDIEVEPNLISLGHKLFWTMKRHSDAAAQIDGATGERETYDSFLRKCIRAAIEMKARGVSLDDVIMPCTTNHMNTFVPFLAALFVGAKVASLDPSLSLSDMKHLIKLMNPKFIFASSNAVEKLEESLRDVSVNAEMVVFGESDGYINFGEFLNPSSEEALFEPSPVSSVYDTAVIYFTSGSTGTSKGISLNHFCITNRAVDGLTTAMAPKVMFTYSPLYWFTSSFTMILTILAGGTNIIASNFSPAKTWNYLETYKVTHLLLSPSQSIALLKHNRQNGINLPNLEMVLTTGGFISTENIAALRRLFAGATLSFFYGQTEVCGAILRFPKNAKGTETMMKKGNSVGQPLRGIWYKVVDPESGKALRPNEDGELRLKTKYVMNGYYNTDSSSAWDSDGWLITGDICYYDEDHCFYIIDRLKELIKYRGWHVAPAFIEGILQQHPAVKTAVVIGIPNEDDIEHALGLVELANDAEGIIPRDLVKYVSDRAEDDRKILHGGVKFVSDIPYTPSGKVKRNLLRAKILAEIDEMMYHN